MPRQRDAIKARVLTGSGCGREPMRELADELHTMSQPMTALLCRLEIGSMTGTLDGYAEAVRESLIECERLMRSIAAMRAMIGRELDGS